MKLSEFKATLDQHPQSNLTILLPDGSDIPAHFHITEVGRTEKKFIDCGGKKRAAALASLQVWVADDIAHRLPAGKLGTIIEKAAGILGNDDLDVQIECQQGTIGLFSIDGSRVEHSNLVFILANKQTACLALEACGLGELKDEPGCGCGPSCC